MNERDDHEAGLFERALRRMRAREYLDGRLGDALRASSITADDAETVAGIYAALGVYDGLKIYNKPSSDRIVAVMHAVAAWVRGGGML